MFTVMIELKDIGELSTFSEAFKLFISKIKEQVNQGTSYQVLETTNFIVLTTADGEQLAMDFYHARDFAYDNGLMKGGKFQEKEELPVEVVQRAFESAMRDANLAQIESFLSVVGIHLGSVN